MRWWQHVGNASVPGNGGRAWASKVAGCGTRVWQGKGSGATFPALSHSYIWQHIEIGYVQGMCDLLAPLLVILDDGE